MTAVTISTARQLAFYSLSRIFFSECILRLATSQHYQYFIGGGRVPGMVQGYHEQVPRHRWSTYLVPARHQVSELPIIIYENYVESHEHLAEVAQVCTW
jgi:hypothetical protein